MNEQTSDLVVGVLIVIVLVPLLYLAARLIIRIVGIWGAHLLSPLSPAIVGIIDKKGPCIRGTYQGHELIVSFTVGHRVSASDSFTREINAFYIEVIDVKGQQDWLIRFGQTGFLGHGPIQLFIQAEQQALQKRLEDSGVEAAVAAVSVPTTGYVTVRYEAHKQKLIYMDDVSPGKLPSLHKYNQQLALVAHLVKVNQQVNPPLSRSM